MKTGYGSYGMDGIYEMGQWDCYPSRSHTCGAVDASGKTTCYDENGCPIFEESLKEGKLTVTRDTTTKVGKELLQERLQQAVKSGEKLSVDILGKFFTINKDTAPATTIKKEPLYKNPLVIIAVFAAILAIYKFRS